MVFPEGCIIIKNYKFWEGNKDSGKHFSYTKPYSMLTKVNSAYDLTFREVVILTMLAVFILFLGFYPSFFIDFIFSSSMYYINYY